MNKKYEGLPANTEGILKKVLIPAEDSAAKYKLQRAQWETARKEEGKWEGGEKRRLNRERMLMLML